jgi:hypothetical protein
MSIAASSMLAVLIGPLPVLRILFECRAGAFCMVYLRLDAEQAKKYITCTLHTIIQRASTNSRRKMKR